MKSGLVEVAAALVAVMLAGCGRESRPTAVCSGNDLALGRSYIKSAEPSVSFSDTDSGEFTDGRDPGAWNTDSGSFGYNHPADSPYSVNLDIDLGSRSRTFNTASVNSGALTDRYVAAALTLSVSNDQQRWTLIGHFPNPTNQFNVNVTFPAVTARFVRFAVEARWNCTDCDWLFLGEGQVSCQ